jgi:hypothetical protein
VVGNEVFTIHFALEAYNSACCNNFFLLFVSRVSSGDIFNHACQTRDLAVTYNCNQIHAEVGTPEGLLKFFVRSPWQGLDIHLQCLIASVSLALLYLIRENDS